MRRDGRAGHWAICDVCHGHGKHSRHMGVINWEEMDRDFDYEEQEAYFNGAYDRVCSTCRGDGKTWIDDGPHDEELAEDDGCPCAECSAERKFQRMQDLKLLAAESGCRHSL